MEKTQKSSHIILIIYSVSLILVPAFKFHEKIFFLAELLLIPFFVYYIFLLFKKKCSLPESSLLYLAIAVLLAFFSGLFRFRTGSEITVYNWGLVDDTFSWGRDGIRVMRWLGMFLTPLMISETLGRSKGREGLLQTFIGWIIIFSSVSSLFTILDHFKILELSHYYPYLYDSNWHGRAYGTFASPLEASLMYAATLGAIMQQGFSRGKCRLKYIPFGGLVFYALILTQSATGIVGAVLAIFYFAFKNNSKRSKKIIGGAILFLILLSSFLLPPQWLIYKFGNFSVRAEMWGKWLAKIPSHPWFAISGMGFTSLIVDNSFLLLLVYGGLILFLAFSNWFLNLLKLTFQESLLPFLIVWISSWVSLDSIGYWGIGRLCWFLLGLATLSNRTMQTKH